MTENPPPASPEIERKPVTRAEFLRLFITLMVPMFMAAVDQTLLATATPAIAGSLGSLRDASWIAVAYLLAAAVIVPMYGRLGDIRGKRQMLYVALGVFVTGSVACAAAQSMPQLIAARVLQGFGGGGLMMLSHALIGELVPPPERVRFQSYFAIVFSASSIGGPVIGGAVVSYVSWRWLFIANIPLAAFALWRLSQLAPGERHPRPGSRADVPGHILFAVSALSLLFWLTSGGHRFTWTSTVSIGLAALAVTALAALIWQERRHPTPFLPIELLRERAVRLSALLVVLFASCMFATIFFLPIYLQLGINVGAGVAGLLLLPVTAGQVIGNFACSRIIRRTGDLYPVPLTGMSITCCGLLLLGLIPPRTMIVSILGFITGLGMGTVMPTTNLIVQTVAGRTRLASGNATLSLSRSTGGAAGAALFGAVVFATMPEVDRQTLTSQLHALNTERVVDAFHRAFLCAAAVAALAAYTASRIPRVRLWPKK